MVRIKTISVLGANGTMGRNIAGIFASYGNAKVYLITRTMEKSRIAISKAIESVRSESIGANMIPKTYEDIEECIKDSDMIFESLPEDIEIKRQIYSKIRPFLKKGCIIASGTSGLSIKKLSREFGNLANNFFGIHMFNPPYVLNLCELIMHDKEQNELSNDLEVYLSSKLKRTVIKVKDTPAFLGNRIGFFVISRAIQLAKENIDQGGIDYIDAIIGAYTGRSMAPLVTADFVGLDITKSIIDYIKENTNDEFNDVFILSDFMNTLIEKGKVGKKSGIGLYYKDNDRKNILVYDIKNHNYRSKNQYQFYFSNEMISKIRNGNYEAAMKILIEDESYEAILCKKTLLEYIVYSLKVTNEVAFEIDACDDAMATGFSWMPPLAMIDWFGGVKSVTKLVKKYLDLKYIRVIEDKEIINKLPQKSKYDYRPYLKAKY